MENVKHKTYLNFFRRLSGRHPGRPLHLSSTSIVAARTNCLSRWQNTGSELGIALADHTYGEGDALVEALSGEAL